MRWLLPVVLIATVAACGGRDRSTLPKLSQTPAVPADDIAVARSGARPVDHGDTGLAEPGAGRDPRVVDLDIIQIRAPMGPGGDRDVTSVATADLFRLAGEAAAAGNPGDAIARYRQIVTEFPQSLYAPVSLFNIAAIQDKQGDPAATITTLRELIQSYPTSRESVEGNLYIAALQAEKQQWAEAIATLDGALARPNLTYADRVEAYARKGYVLLELHRYDDADIALTAAQGEWRKAPRIDDPYYIAMAAYYGGEVAHQRFAEAPVRLPDDQLLTDLEAKRVLAVQAYDRWKASLAYNHAYWGTAAGYQMSQIFVELWEVTVKAPFPTHLAVTDRPRYLTEVHDKARVHLTKALDGHRMNLELAKAYGVETSWSRGSAVRAAQVFEMLQRDTAGNYVQPTP